ncbi:hypothetical protein EDC96DRAFT_504600 [Choanephora cucurbitarum]|nr:hypothetical protein EDC96DRAFT_504600 [Choanephora cucurbitarum]
MTVCFMRTSQLTRCLLFLFVTYTSSYNKRRLSPSIDTPKTVNVTDKQNESSYQKKKYQYDKRRLSFKKTKSQNICQLEQH